MARKVLQKQETKYLNLNELYLFSYPAMATTSHASNTTANSNGKLLEKPENIYLDLIPTIVESHRHRTNKRFHSGCGLIVGCAKTPLDILVVQDLEVSTKGNVGSGKLSPKKDETKKTEEAKNISKHSGGTPFSKDDIYLT